MALGSGDDDNRRIPKVSVPFVSPDDSGPGSGEERNVPSKSRKARSARSRAVTSELGEVGRNMNEANVNRLMDQAAAMGSRSIEEPASPRFMNVPSFKRGGTMRKRGVARLHKGERVQGRKKGRRRSR